MDFGKFDCTPGSGIGLRGNRSGLQVNLVRKGAPKSIYLVISLLCGAYIVATFDPTHNLKIITKNLNLVRSLKLIQKKAYKSIHLLISLLCGRQPYGCDLRPDQQLKIITKQLKLVRSLKLVQKRAHKSIHLLISLLYGRQPYGCDLRPDPQFKNN